MVGAVLIHDEDIFIFEDSAGRKGSWNFYGHNILSLVGGRVGLLILQGIPRPPVSKGISFTRIFCNLLVSIRARSTLALLNQRTALRCQRLIQIPENIFDILKANT